MAITIGANLVSLKTQRSLARAGQEWSQVAERLSSGQRINKASDDAAGLSIVSTLNSKSRIFAQSIKNANDGISVLSVADGALAELSNVVTRLRELAAQSANGTYSAKQRVALDNEAQALSLEYNRIARSTEFNGLKLFDSSFGSLSLQTGIGSEGALQASIGGGIGDGTFRSTAATTTVYGLKGVSGDVNGDGLTDLVTWYNHAFGGRAVLIGRGDGTFSVNNTSSSTVDNYLFSDFNDDGVLDTAHNSLSSGVVATLGRGDGTFAQSSTTALANFPAGLATADFNSDGFMDVATTGSNAGVYSLIIYSGRGDGTFSATTTSAVSGGGSLQAADLNGDGNEDLISTDSITDTTQILIGRGDGTFSVGQSIPDPGSPFQMQIADINNDGKKDILTANGGTNQLSAYVGRGDGTFSLSTTIAGAASGIELGDFNGDGNQDILNSGNGSVNLYLGSGNGSFQSAQFVTSALGGANAVTGDFDGDGVTDFGVTTSVAVFTTFLGNRKDGLSALNEFSLKSRFESKMAMKYFEEVQNRIGKQRGVIGASQARIDVSRATLESSLVESRAAAGRISDADIAAESANLLRTSILQQAGAALLAQANLQPSLALTLLKG